ncbi:GntR family transcriptional regulator [Variovorax sp. J22P271]|uniref:GntR family transcriptional regulator n=1 Tax=Variovorax davisae TaxID=3053515 RepID=UPI002576AAA9|nr:GntR family transcriptional regulator [Variovorax sp. J22P271]MDM0034486.1 GntR family transcriptional regulator [Variovorax sp. J22P271]
MASSPRINLSDKIREALEAEIVSGKLDAGSRIDEQELMDRFAVSRTPAREAILQLMSAGLVTTLPRQGAVVATLSLPEYIAMLEILMELEGLAARLAARRMPAAQRKQLQEAHGACQRAAAQDDAEAYGQANRVFHEIIYDGSLNEVLARQLRSMRLRMRHPQRALFDRPNRIRNSLAEHQTLLEAIVAGDEDAAYRAMTGHISSGGNVYADAIASMPAGRALAAPRKPEAPAAPPAGRRRAVEKA